MSVEKNTTSPLIQLEMFRDPILSAGFIMSSLVTTVMMSTLVVGPFYLSGALALNVAAVGLVMSVGPIVAAFAGVPAGRMVDKFGARRMTKAGLLSMLVGSSILPILPTSFGIPGYIGPMAVITAGYALFQAANNTAIMINVRPDQKGLVSGILNLSRNLGLITGASVMGIVFSQGSASTNILKASSKAVATGMSVTFLVAAALMILALAVSCTGNLLAHRAFTRAKTACPTEVCAKRRTHQQQPDGTIS